MCQDTGPRCSSCQSFLVQIQAIFCSGHAVPAVQQDGSHQHVGQSWWHHPCMCGCPGCSRGPPLLQSTWATSCPPHYKGPEGSDESQGILVKNFRRKIGEFVLPTFQPDFDVLLPDGLELLLLLLLLLLLSLFQRTTPECEAGQEGGTDSVPSAPKLSSGQQSTGIYGGERE